MVCNFDVKHNLGEDSSHLPNNFQNGHGREWVLMDIAFLGFSEQDSDLNLILKMKIPFI